MDERDRELLSAPWSARSTPRKMAATRKATAAKTMKESTDTACLTKRGLVVDPFESLERLGDDCQSRSRIGAGERLV